MGFCYTASVYLVRHIDPPALIVSILGWEEVVAEHEVSFQLNVCSSWILDQAHKVCNAYSSVHKTIGHHIVCGLHVRLSCDTLR